MVGGQTFGILFEKEKTSKTSLAKEKGHHHCLSTKNHI